MVSERRFALPPALAKLPLGRHRLPTELVEQNQRDRIMLGALSVFGEKGFAAATVQDLIEEAAVSRATYYKYFDDKAACLAALHDEVLGWLEQVVRDAARSAADWPNAVLAVGRRLVEVLVADPRIARICTVEWMLAGPVIRERQEAALAELMAGLRRGREERAGGGELPDLTESFLLSGALFMLAREVAYGERSGARALTHELPELILIPYLGAAEARRIVA